MTKQNKSKKSRVKATLTRTVRNTKRIKGLFRKSDSLRKREQKARDDGIERRACEDPDRRKRLEADPPAWLKHYLAGFYPASWSKAHLAIIHGAIEAAKTGTGYAAAAPRGEGKTTVLRGVDFFLVATGVCRFPVMGGWTHKSSSEAFRVWIRMLHNTPALAADYPELTQPFEESMHAGRLKALTWSDTGAECGAEVRSTDKIIVLPDSRGAIGAASVQGDVKGLSVTLPSGEVLRPDLILFDDVQDPKRAGDPAHVQDVIDIIEKQWICLAGPTSRITAMAACTVAASNDVSEYFLNKPDFKSVRISRIESWPKGWDEKGSQSRLIWDNWHNELLDGMADGDGGQRGRDFYQSNKSEMTDGMTVSWSERMDKKRHDPDALYSAMFDFYRIGEAAFASEYQNRPLKQGATVYDLRPEIVMSRTDDKRDAFAVPAWSRLVTAFTDINHYGLHSVCAAFGQDQTAAVLWYQCFDRITVPERAPEAERRQIIFQALCEHGKTVGSLPCKPDLWLIDGGYEHETIQRYVNGPARICGTRAMVSRGYGADKYRPNGKNLIGKAREECHYTQWPLGRGIAYNADYWREIAQRAWLGDIGAPGACSIFAGHHRDFSEQICRERLSEKLISKTGMIWRFITMPGRHDYGDAMTGCYVAAAWHGIGAGGQVITKKYIERRKPKVQREF
jgi:hypothetical protein